MHALYDVPKIKEIWKYIRWRKKSTSEKEENQPYPALYSSISTPVAVRSQKNHASGWKVNRKLMWPLVLWLTDLIILWHWILAFPQRKGQFVTHCIKKKAFVLMCCVFISLFVMDSVKVCTPSQKKHLGDLPCCSRFDESIGHITNGRENLPKTQVQRKWVLNSNTAIQPINEWQVCLSIFLDNDYNLLTTLVMIAHPFDFHGSGFFPPKLCQSVILFLGCDPQKEFLGNFLNSPKSRGLDLQFLKKSQNSDHL